MTKEEFIRNAIENHKEGEPVCHNVSCNDCLYDFATCDESVVYGLLDYIIDHETPQETNLEHYFNIGDVIVYLGQQIIHLNDNCWDAYKNSNSSHIVEWLLLPYEEPPKPKYKLTQFEYDVLDSYDYLHKANKFNVHYSLRAMKDKGYFKGVPDDASMSILDIIKNAEVIDK